MIFNFNFDVDNLGGEASIDADTGVMEFIEIATVFKF